MLAANVLALVLHKYILLYKWQMRGHTMPKSSQA